MYEKNVIRSKGIKMIGRKGGRREEKEMERGKDGEKKKGRERKKKEKRIRWR